MRTRRAALLGVLGGSIVSLGGAVRAVFAQQGQGVAARAGRALDNMGRGIKQEAQFVGDAVRRQFETVRSEVNRMGVQPRVYSRLHWDKALVGSRIEVHVLRGGVATLKGSVPDEAARTRAVTLARETVDVASVIDELTTATTTTSITPRRRRLIR